MDAIIVFLYGDIDGDAYIELLEGWKDENRAIYGFNKIGLLIKVLYRLK